MFIDFALAFDDIRGRKSHYLYKISKLVVEFSFQKRLNANKMYFLMVLETMVCVHDIQYFRKFTCVSLKHLF